MLSVVSEPCSAKGLVTKLCHEWLQLCTQCHLNSQVRLYVSDIYLSSFLTGPPGLNIVPIVAGAAAAGGVLVLLRAALVICIVVAVCAKKSQKGRGKY